MRDCDEPRVLQDEAFGTVTPPQQPGPRMAAMESVTAMLIVVFQLFFGWCGAEDSGGQAAQPQSTDESC